MQPTQFVVFARARRRRSGPRSRADDAAALRRIERLAHLLDTSIGIPGTGFRFGLDPILGLFPGGGDVVGAALSSVIVMEAWRLGAPAGLLMRMAGNIATETLVGSVPLAGDLFDAWFKANRRNLALIRAWLQAEGRI